MFDKCSSLLMDAFWCVIGEKGNFSSSLISSQSNECWWGGCSVVICWDPVKHTYIHTHTHIHIHIHPNQPSMINSYHLLLSSIDLANRGLHWLRSPADYNQKDAQSEVFFKPEDKKDRCMAVKFLRLNLSRCHLPIFPSHPMFCANTSCFICLKFLQCPRRAREGEKLLELFGSE